MPTFLFDLHLPRVSLSRFSSFSCSPSGRRLVRHKTTIARHWCRFLSTSQALKNFDSPQASGRHIPFRHSLKQPIQNNYI